MSVARRCDLRPGAHPDKGKTFIVIDGQLRIDFRDGSAALQAGVVFVVPKAPPPTPPEVGADATIWRGASDER